MKKTLSLIALILVAVMMFAACQQSPSEGTTPAPTDDGKVTVCWYYGSKLLKEEQVEKGSKLTSWEPTEEGKTFAGWYSEASATVAFDFEATIEADTDIFAAFMSNEYVEDTTSYYLIGTGSGSMKASGWDHTASANNLTMTKDTSVTDANIYTIEIEMYAGDRFQICHDGSWDGQFGIGGIKGCEYAAGINPNKPAEGEKTAEDKKYAEVKNEAGEVVFIGGDENNSSFTSWNAILNEGHDGKYKITLVTYPNNPGYNYITYELIEKLEPMSDTHKMHFIGTFNEWSTDYSASQDWDLTPSEDKSYWTGIITITEDMYADSTATDPANASGELCAAVKIFNSVDGAYHGDPNNQGNNIFLKAGTYGFKYTVETNMVEWQEMGYYVVGTMLDADGNAVNFSVKDGVTPKLTVSGDKATGTFEVYDATKGPGYDWMTAQGKPGVMAVKVVYGCEYIIRDWYAADANGDNWYLPLGTYEVVMDIAAGSATITAK